MFLGLQQYSMSKAQLLHVQSKEDEELIFQWNYANVSPDAIYFRHVIVVFSEDREYANAFVKKYIKKVKGGDLYYVMYTNRKNKPRHVGWKQKPVIDQNYSSKSILRQEISTGNIDATMVQVQNFYSEFSEPVVVTFLLDSVQKRQYIQSRILQKRNHQKYDFLVALFAPIEKNTLSFGYKISIFSTAKEEFEGKVDFFLSNVYQAGLLYAKLTIECRNGSITSMVDTNWKTTAFNQIERIYRGPSIKYNKDIIFFYNHNLQESYEDLVLKLEFVTLQKKMFKTQKKVSVYSSKSFYQKTFNMEPWVKSFHAGKDVWLTENPFNTFTVIKFQANQKGIG